MIQFIEKLGWIENVNPAKLLVIYQMIK